MRRRSGRSHSNFDPPLTPGGDRRDAGCRNSRRQESRGSRSDDAAQHGITVAAAAVVTVVVVVVVVVTHGCAVPASAAPIVAVADAGTAASAFRDRRLLHYAPRAERRGIFYLNERASRVRSRAFETLASRFHAKFPAVLVDSATTSLGAANLTVDSGATWRLRPPIRGQATARRRDSLGARTRACPLSTPTRAARATRPPVSPRIRARVSRRCTHAPCQRRALSRSVLTRARARSPALSFLLRLLPLCHCRHDTRLRSREHATPGSLSFFPRRRAAPHRFAGCTADARRRARKPPSRFLHGAVRTARFFNARTVPRGLVLTPDYTSRGRQDNAPASRARRDMGEMSRYGHRQAGQPLPCCHRTLSRFNRIRVFVNNK